jgi:hypothetical protein
MDFKAALASSVVASIDTVLPLTNPSSVRTFSTQPKTALCVSSQNKRRVREIVEWSGVVSSSAYPRNFRNDRESAVRQAIPRSESRPSK